MKISKHLEVGQEEIIKLMIQLMLVNQLGSKIRAQNVARKLGQGGIPYPLPSRCASVKNNKSGRVFRNSTATHSLTMNRCFRGKIIHYSFYAEKQF